MKDLNDRELEKFLQENNAAKWFCGFGIIKRTPNFSVFSKVRALISKANLWKESATKPLKPNMTSSITRRFLR